VNIAKEEKSMATKLMSGTLQPGQSQSFFVDNVNKQVARVITAVPTGLPVNDQFIEISEVFYILKGSNHPPGFGPDTLQLNYTVHNRDDQNPAAFEVYMAEM
jgi:hypothetical protein